MMSGRSTDHSTLLNTITGDRVLKSEHHDESSEGTDSVGAVRDLTKPGTGDVMWGARGPSVMHTGSLVTVDSELSNDAHIFERLFRQAVQRKDIQLISRMLCNAVQESVITTRCPEALKEAQVILEEWRVKQGPGDMIDFWNPIFTSWYTARIVTKLNDRDFVLTYPLAWNPTYRESVLDCTFVPPYTMVGSATLPIETAQSTELHGLGMEEGSSSEGGDTDTKSRRRRRSTDSYHSLSGGSDTAQTASGLDSDMLPVTSVITSNDKTAKRFKSAIAVDIDTFSDCGKGACGASYTVSDKCAPSTLSAASAAFKTAHSGNMVPSIGTVSYTPAGSGSENGEGLFESVSINPPTPLPQNPAALTLLRIGIIGLSSMTQSHLENATTIRAVRVVVVADSDQEAARKTCIDYNIPAYITDWRLMVKSPLVDAVIICSPPDQHAEQIMMALQGGKYVFVEKTVSPVLHEIVQVRSVIHETMGHCMVGFHRRFDPSILRIRRRIENGEVGDILHMHITSREPGRPASSLVGTTGGFYHDLSLHDFDLALFLTQAPALEVTAYGSCRLDSNAGDTGDVDISMVMIRFQHGIVVVIDNCRQCPYGYDHRVEVLGSRCMIQCDNMYRTTCRVSDTYSVRAMDTPIQSYSERYREAFRAELLSFVDGVRTQSPPSVGIEAGWNAAVLASAARLSLLRKTPIKISAFNRDTGVYAE
mmetsp:Transcript_20942/g.30186  ORF Transcript_20942/g.30186 Transcript_20942/m.30186 type:complete len:706 (+) Transcript_20942:88-2205(+)